MRMPVHWGSGLSKKSNQRAATLAHSFAGGIHTGRTVGRKGVWMPCYINLSWFEKTCCVKKPFEQNLYQNGNHLLQHI